jgi:hypothetical protein
MLLLAFATIANAQEKGEISEVHKTISPDGKLQVVFYYECYNGMTHYFKIQDISTEEVLHQIDIRKYMKKVVEAPDENSAYYGVGFVRFTPDSRKLLFGSGVVTYEYILATKEINEILNELSFPVTPINMVGDTIILRGTKNMGKLGTTYTNGFFKYINGHYIAFQPKEYYDYLNHKKVFNK